MIMTSGRLGGLIWQWVRGGRGGKQKGDGLEKEGRKRTTAG